MILKDQRESLGRSLVRVSEIMREEGLASAASFNQTGEADGVEVVLTIPSELVRKLGQLILPGSTEGSPGEN